MKLFLIFFYLFSTKGWLIIYHFIIHYAYDLRKFGIISFRLKNGERERQYNRFNKIIIIILY